MLFYCYKRKNDIVVEHLTQMEAIARVEKGDPFLDIGKKTLEDAKALREALLAQKAHL